jgi:hypothetical protein
VSEKPELPAGAQRFIDGLQSFADKLKAKADANYRALGWQSPEEVAAAQRVLQLIHEKSAAPTPGTEAATLRSIHQVVSDLLSAPPAGGRVE